MKRPSKSQTSQVTPSRRSLRIESLEDRKLMTVATELVQLPQESQIGSEHWPEPAAEIAVEKATNGRQGFFSRGLHNNGAFREPTGHILWNTADDSETSSDSYTDSGRITYYAYELKNVQVTSVVATTNEQNELKRDPIFRLHDRSVDKVFGENGFGGQEGEAGTENQFSLNFEEIKVTYTENDNTGKKVGRSNGIVGGTMCSARSSNDPVFFSHHANIDAIWGEALPSLSELLDYDAGIGGWSPPTSVEAEGFYSQLIRNVVVMNGQETVDPSNSFTPTTDLPDGDYYLQGKSDPIDSFSLNFEEIKVTYQASENSWNDCSPADNVVLEDVVSVIQKHCE